MWRKVCCLWWLGLLLALSGLTLASEPPFTAHNSAPGQIEGRPVELYSNMTQDFLPLAETRSHALAQYPVLKVGMYCCSAAPLQMPRWDGKLEGIYPDYLQLLQMVLKRPVQAMLYNSWEQAYQALQRGDIQLLTQSDFLQSANRDNETDPLLVQPLMLMVRKNHQTTPLSSLHILAAPDISPTVIEHLRTLYPHLEVARSSTLAIQSVVNDQADAYLDGQSQITLFSALRPVAGVVWRRDPALDELLYGFVGRSGDGVLEVINDILTNIPHSIKNEIYQRWVSGLSQSANNDASIFTPQEIDWIKQHPVINVAIDIDIPPYSFLDKNDEITGLDVDILQLVAEKSGLNLNFIPAFEPAGVEQALRAGKAQMTPSLMDSPDRRGWLSYSDPYGIVEWVMITRNERSAPFTPEQLAHKRVAIQRGHALLAAMQLYPSLSIVEVASVPEAVDMMLAGAVDATFASIGSANYLQSSRYGSRIAVQPLDNAFQPERFAVLPAYPQLTEILNKSLHVVAPNEIRALRMHWFSVANLASYNTMISPWIIVWGGALCVIALSSVFWGTYLARQIGLRKKADRRLQELLAWWETLFNNVPTPMFVCAPDMTVTAANLWFCRVMGKTPPDIVGSNLFSLRFLSPADEQDIRGIFLRCLSGEMPHFSDRRVFLQGEEREGYLWFEGYRNTEGVMLGVMGGWFDVTERKSLARELRLARDKAEQASHEKSEFLARMSHEIRTPLHAIIGILELAVKQQRESDAPLHIAWQAADSLQGIIGDVLDFSKIEAGNIDITLQPASLTQLLENCAATFRISAEDKGLELLTAVSIPQSALHWLDSIRLSQVINNLLLNAIKFTANGKIQLRAAIHYRANDPRDRITIEIEDSGCGIPPDMYQAVLQPYVRVETAQGVPGTGLGLPISAKLIALMGGTLQLCGSESGGVRVTVELMLKRAATQLLIPPAQGAADATMEEESLNILVVDDLAVNLQVLALQFATSDHYVELVGSGDEALQEVEQHYYDVVLTDCQMQGMDGYRLTAHLRQHQQRHQLPPYAIIGCTANAFATERDRCLEAGMDEVLIKPLSQTTLLNGITQVWQQISSRGVATEPFAEIQALAQADVQQEQALLTSLLQGMEQDLEGIIKNRDGDHVSQLAHYAHRLHAAFALLPYYPGMRVCLRIEKTQRFDRQTIEALEKYTAIMIQLIKQRLLSINSEESR